MKIIASAGRRFLAVLILASISVSSMFGVARAQTAAEFYRGKTVHFVVGVAVGGGTDAYARMIGPYLARELGATVVVENVHGAGGMLALNRVYAAQPDGLRVHIANGTPATLGQLQGLDGIKYDMLNFAHLGIVGAYPWVWIVASNGPYKSLEDLVKSGAALRWGGTAPGDGPGDGAAISCAALKLNCKMVMGYRSTGEIALAMSRGEVDAIYLSDSSASVYTRNGSALPIASMARVRTPLLPNVPSIFELTKVPKETEWMLDFREALNDLGRLLVTTQGVPADRLAYLREAVRRALTNPDLIAEANKTLRVVRYQAPEDAMAAVRKVLVDTSAEQRAQIKKVLTYH